VRFNTNNEGSVYVDTRQSRRSRRVLLATIGAAALLAACGGDAPDGPKIAEFSVDRPAVNVGETVRLTAHFSGGSARIEPEIGAISSGVPVQTPPLAGAVTFRLIVDNRVTQVSRTVDVSVSYRNRYRPLAQPFVSARHVAAQLGDGSLLIIGGDRGESVLSHTIVRYDPATERFSDIGSLGSGRAFHSATVLANDRVLVAGGIVALTGFNASELIDARTGGVALTGALNQRRHDHAATRLIDGRVLVTGGWAQGGSSGPLASAEIWDPATGEFRLLPAPMVTARSGHTATLLADGRVLVAGGFSFAANYSYAEIFDPATETFTPVTGSQQEPRALHSAHRLADGSVLLLGGENGTSTAATAAVLRFDPLRGVIEPVAALLAPRSVVASVLAADERVLLFGGYDVNLLPASNAEAYRRDVGGTALSPLPQARVWHSVTRLSDGRVLVLGGDDSNGNLVAAALLFE
jgi:hypothetical protein